MTSIGRSNLPLWNNGTESISTGSARLLFIAFQFAHASVLWAIQAESPAFVLIVSGFTCLVSYLSLLRIELRSLSVSLRPIDLYLVSGALRVGIGTFYVGLTMTFTSLTLIRIGVYPINNELIAGQLIMIISDIFLLSGYYIFEKSRFGRVGAPKANNVSSLSIVYSVVILFVMGWTFKILGLFGMSGVLPTLIASSFPPAGSLMLLSLADRVSTRNSALMKFIAWGAIVLNVASTVAGSAKISSVVAVLPLVLFYGRKLYYADGPSASKLKL